MARFNPKQRRAMSMGIVGLLAFTTGTFLPPEIIADLLGAF
jgi:hypothetical protein